MVGKNAPGYVDEEIVCPNQGSLTLSTELEYVQILSERSKRNNKSKSKANPTEPVPEGTADSDIARVGVQLKEIDGAAVVEEEVQDEDEGPDGEEFCGCLQGCGLGEVTADCALAEIEMRVCIQQV